MREVIEKVQSDMFALERAGTATTINRFLERHNPTHHQMLFGGADDEGHEIVMQGRPEDHLHRWLTGQFQRGVKRSVTDLHETSADLHLMNRSERLELYDD